MRSKIEAATYLFEQTGDDAYLQFVEDNYAVVVPEWGPNQWMAQEQEALLYFSMPPGVTESVATVIREQFRHNVTTHADQFASVAGETDPYRAYVQDYVWGSNSSKAAQGVLFQYLDDYDLDDAVAPAAVDAAEGYVHYLHGVNPLGLVYLSNMWRAGAEHSVSTFSTRGSLTLALGGER